MIDDLHTTSLQTWRQHAVGLGKLIGQNLELANGLGTGYSLVRRIDHTLDFGMDDGVLRQRLTIRLPLSALGGKPRIRIRKIQRDQSGDERLFVADDQALTHYRRRHDGRFKNTGRHVLAAGGDDQILLAPGDGHETILADAASRLYAASHR